MIGGGGVGDIKSRTSISANVDPFQMLPRAFPDDVTRRLDTVSKTIDVDIALENGVRIRRPFDGEQFAARSQFARDWNGVSPDMCAYIYDDISFAHMVQNHSQFIACMSAEIEQLFGN